jgi:tripartite-type tricarboxylate transporter receptor subunit TctC
MRTSLAAIVAASLLAAPAANHARAQTYPDRPVRVVVPFPAGGVADAVARIVAQKLGDSLGQNLVIENRTGASGTLGAAAVAKSTPDGYTLLMTTGDFLTMQGVMPPMPFDPMKDLTAIAMLAVSPLVLAANPESGIASVKDLVAAAKARPGAIAYSSPGLGTVNQLAVEWVALDAGIKLLHVPYRGGAPAATAVATGEVQIGAVTPSSAGGLIQADKVKVVALMTKQRPSFTPDWPTVAEAGLDVDAALWVGLFAPAGTPATIVDQLDSQVRKVLQAPDVRAQLNTVGTDPSPISQAAFVQRIKADAAHYSRIIQSIGLRPQQ